MFCCPADDSGREALFGLLVLVGLVGYAPNGGVCCCESEPGRDWCWLTSEGTATSAILPPGPGPEGCGVSWGSAVGTPDAV